VINWDGANIPAFWSVCEVAVLYGMTPRAVRYMIKCGGLQSVKFGSGLRAKHRIPAREVIDRYPHTRQSLDERIALMRREDDAA